MTTVLSPYHPHLHIPQKWASGFQRLHRSSTTSQIESPAKSGLHDRQRICSWDSHTLCPIEQVLVDSAQKFIGRSSKELKATDFEWIVTLGTGTFARVNLVRFQNSRGDERNKVFALKKLLKSDVIRLKQIEHVKNERKILAEVAGHPFITTMLASFQERDAIYMLLDYCPGGELFTYLRRARRFEEDTARFYAAEICLILEFLHNDGITYRDLKPENILIDSEGHLKLVDFGFAKKIGTKDENGNPDVQETYTLCGTPEYLAPEVIRNTGHGLAVDWWAFGILIFELLVGQPPFWDPKPMQIYEQILQGQINYPSVMSNDAKDLVSKLCRVDVAERLGYTSGGAQSIKDHVWFRSIVWDDIAARRGPGKIVPLISSPTDTRNFDRYPAEPLAKNRYSQELYNKYNDEFADF